MRTWFASALVVCVVSLAGGCGKKVPPTVPQALAPVGSPSSSSAPEPAAAEAAARVNSTALTEDELFARKSVEDLNAERVLGDVFFEYDSAEIQAEARQILQQNARWLMRWPSTRVTIEGHCDERGTAEYNLALGEQRASRVRAYVAGLGVSSDRIITVSKGKEQPFCPGRGEACWSQNRRAHFMIVGK